MPDHEAKTITLDQVDTDQWFTVVDLVRSDRADDQDLLCALPRSGSYRANE